MHGPYFFIEHFILDLPLVKATICFIKQFGAVTRERPYVKCPITTMMKSSTKTRKWKTVRFMLDFDFGSGKILFGSCKIFCGWGKLFFGSDKIFFGSGKLFFGSGKIFFACNGLEGLSRRL